MQSGWPLYRFTCNKYWLASIVSELKCAHGYFPIFSVYSRSFPLRSFQYTLIDTHGLVGLCDRVAGNNRWAIIKFLTAPNRAVGPGEENTESGMVAGHAQAGCVYSVLINGHYFTPCWPVSTGMEVTVSLPYKAISMPTTLLVH
jgi:hypothetical protein